MSTFLAALSDSSSRSHQSARSSRSPFTPSEFVVGASPVCSLAPSSPVESHFLCKGSLGPSPCSAVPDLGALGLSSSICGSVSICSLDTGPVLLSLVQHVPGI